MIWEVRYKISRKEYIDRLDLNTFDKKEVKDWFLEHKVKNLDLIIGGDKKYIDAELIFDERG